MEKYNVNIMKCIGTFKLVVQVFCLSSLILLYSFCLSLSPSLSLRVHVFARAYVCARVCDVKNVFAELKNEVDNTTFSKSLV